MEYMVPILISSLIGLAIFAVKVAMVRESTPGKPEYPEKPAVKNNILQASNAPQTGWISEFYRDQFQNPTDIKYITTRQELPATSRDPYHDRMDVKVQLIVDNQSVYLHVSVLGVVVAPHPDPFGTPYFIELLTESGKKVSFNGTVANDYIYLDNPKAFVNILIDEQQPFKVHISRTSAIGKQEGYLFSVDPRGFEQFVRRKEPTA